VTRDHPRISPLLPTRHQGVPTWTCDEVCARDRGVARVSAHHTQYFNRGTAAGPFTGHTNMVLSVAFSPEGQRIVSGSSDRTIRVWSTTMGETVAGPFTGHTGTVRSVAFSPDGHRIISGSEDRTIRVWNATTEEIVAGPFTGHTDSVSSVAFLPYGERIVSGSEDGTIRVWNATTGETVAGPFTGHTDLVYSVAFSPDGQRIVSGSQDRTIRVWNVSTGGTAAGPFTGHVDSVQSVAFSPDDQRVIPSERGSIPTLNTTTGNTVTTRHADFTDQSIINDEGWICGSNDELLVWIPLIHRAHLHRPSNIWVAGEHETRIDLSTSVHGPSWTTCIDALIEPL